MAERTFLPNRHFVAGNVSGSRVFITKPPNGPLTKDEALELAAWIVICAGFDMAAFQEAYKRVTEGVSSNGDEKQSG